jgi:hypothetical protein
MALESRNERLRLRAVDDVASIMRWGQIEYLVALESRNEG